MLARLRLPGLLILPAAAGAGKTLVAGAIADWFRRRGDRVAVSVPLASGASHRREGLVSEEAEFLAACADARHPLDLICPQRYGEPLIPSIAARRAGRPPDWEAIARSHELMARDSQVMIVQAPATLMTPLDESHTVLDMTTELRTPVVLVARAGLHEINGVVLTLNALRAAQAPIAGVVINRYPAENPTVDQEASLREMEKWAKSPLLCVVPQEEVPGPELPEGISTAIDLVDWRALATRRGSERR